MSDSNEKRAPELVDYGDGTEEYVDELARIDHDGAISHLIFARRSRPGSSVHNALQRRVVVRLIIPTVVLMRMGRSLMAGARPAEEQMPEEARLH
jgi:hypothetical protein